MMIIDIQKVIRETLRDGETSESVNAAMLNLGKGHMLRDFDGLKRRMVTRDGSPLIPPTTTRSEFKAALTTAHLSAAVMQRFEEIAYDHKVGYLGEAAVHSSLNQDWHALFEFNKLSVYGGPDGYVYECGDFPSLDEPMISDDVEYDEPVRLSFDAKTHHKHQGGLSRTPDRVNYDLYILCHWNVGLMNVIGYITKALFLSADQRNKYGELYIPPTVPPLHCFEEFLSKFHAKYTDL
jgi:hypothetical protein